MDVAPAAIESVTAQRRSDEWTAAWIREHDGATDTLEGLALPGRRITFRKTYRGQSLAMPILAADWQQQIEAGNSLPFEYERGSHGRELKRYQLDGKEGTIQDYYVTPGSKQFVLVVELDDGVAVSMPIARNSDFAGTYLIR